jgi:HlyD family secretion protein
MKKIAIIAIVALAFICFFFLKWEKKHEAENTNLEASEMGVGALGRIEPRSKVLNLYDDSGPDGARVEILHVKEGDEVKSGDILVTFSSNGRKKAALELAKIKLEDLKEKIKLQQISYEISEREYNRYSALLQSKSVSVDAKDKAYAAFNDAASKLSSLKSEFSAAEIELTIAEDELKRTYISAPIDGTILKIHSYPGEKISSEGIMEIADLKHFDVVAEVYERDISKVKKGQKAEIFIDGIEDRFEGVVDQLSFQVYKNDINKTDPLANRDNRVVEVRISILENQNLEIVRHMIYRQVQVRILLDNILSN